MVGAVASGIPLVLLFFYMSVGLSEGRIYLPSEDLSRIDPKANATYRGEGAQILEGSEERVRSTPKVLAKDASSSFLLTRREPNEEEIRAASYEGLTPDELEEVLVVKGVKVPLRSYMAFSVFINLPNADRRTPVYIEEFVGQITNIPYQLSMGDPYGRRSADFRLDIGACVISLNIPALQSIAVTFVPVSVEEDVLFDGLETEWL